jgi:hypothetical protein
MIEQAKIRGIIDALIAEVSGYQYRVVYWHDGRRNVVWVYSNEISLIPDVQGKETHVSTQK